MMAECVSCGREVPPGKLFCDECYVRMKGRMGPRKKPFTPAEAASGAGPHYRTAVPGAGAEKPPEAIAAQGEEKGKKGAVARDVLTPASQKKVVSIKPLTDKEAREKGRSAKKLTITITFSERTYERLARFKSKIGRRGGRRREKGSPRSTPAVSAPAPRKRRRKGPYGRPLLRAVGGASMAGTASRGRIAGALLYRRRAWDGGDYFSAVSATCVTAAILALPFLDWVRLRWVSTSGDALQPVGVKGIDLGVLVHAAMALAALAWAFLAASVLAGGGRLKIDFGVALLAAGLIIMPLVYVALSNDAGIYDAAVKAMQHRGVPVPLEVAGYERKTSWPAYLMVFSGMILSFSGLTRLSERRAKGVAEKADGGKGEA